jgi:ketosteroid isomerase-like protein
LGTDDDDEPIRAVRAAVAALNRGDADGYLAHFDPSCPRWFAGAEDPVSLDVVGEGIRDLIDAFDGVHLDEEALFGSDGLVCARWILRGHHARPFLGVAASRRDIAVHTCEIYEVRDGMVTTVWTYQDPLALLQQIGAA